MKTKNALLIVALTIANLAFAGKAYAADENSNASKELDAVNNEIEKSIKFQVPSIDASSDSENVTNGDETSFLDRQVLEDLTQVPWMLKEVIVRPMKKNVKNENDCEVTACLAK